VSASAGKHLAKVSGCSPLLPETSIAAFIALTAFSSRIDNDSIKLFFAGFTLLAAVVLILELHSI
jgi:hypothetical protein